MVFNYCQCGWIFGVVIVVALLSFYRPLQTQQLLATQVAQQKHLGDKTLNALLYEYQRKHSFETGIITNWDVMPPFNQAAFKRVFL